MTRHKSPTKRHDAESRNYRPGYPPRSNKEKEFVLRLKVGSPKFSQHYSRGREFFSAHKSRPFAIAGVAVALLVIVGLYLLYANQQANQEPLSPTGQAARHFTPLTDTRNGAETEYRFDTQTNVLSFNSLYNDVTLTISQQPVSEEIAADPEELARIARQINAENSIESEKGRVFIASDPEASTQTAVFTTDETLVFIRAHRTLTNEEWQDYINQLEYR